MTSPIAPHHLGFVAAAELDARRRAANDRRVARTLRTAGAARVRPRRIGRRSGGR